MVECHGSQNLEKMRLFRRNGSFGRNPSRGAMRRAFSLIELLILMVCIVTLCAIILPLLAKSRARSSRINCSNNLKNITLSFRIWSTDNEDKWPMQVSVTNGGTREFVESGAVHPHFKAMSNELSTPKILNCPQDKGRVFAADFINLKDRNLSYFINLDARYEDGSSLLCGDRNITNRPHAGYRRVPLTHADSLAWDMRIHNKKGYMAFGDGRVDIFTNATVGKDFKIGIGATNRLAVP